MIPTDLKPGAILRCVNGAAPDATGRNKTSPHGNVYPVRGEDYRLVGYVMKPVWGCSTVDLGVRIGGSPNMQKDSDQGWSASRFRLVSVGDGGDYQPKGDVDLDNDASCMWRSKPSSL